MRISLSAALARWVEASDAKVLERFAARDALAGREISWEGAGAPGAGRAAGVDARGNLLVDTESGERTALGAGEVTLRLQ